MAIVLYRLSTNVAHTPPTDLLQLQFEGSVALWHDSWPGVQNHPEVRLR